MGGWPLQTTTFESPANSRQEVALTDYYFLESGKTPTSTPTSPMCNVSAAIPRRVGRGRIPYVKLPYLDRRAEGAPEKKLDLNLSQRRIP